MSRNRKRWDSVAKRFRTRSARTFMAGCVLWSACQQTTDDTEAADEAPDVAVVTVSEETIETRREWTGIVQSLRTHVVTAREGGEVAEVVVRDGDTVAADDLLVRVRQPELEARVMILRERRMLLEAELSGWEELAQADAAGPAEVEQARLRLMEVEESLGEAEARLEGGALRAPVSGLVTRVIAATGAQVSAGVPLMEIRRDDALGMRLIVPARERPYLDRSDRLRLMDSREHSWSIARVVSVEEAEVPNGFVSVEVWVEDDLGDWPIEGELLYSEERAALVAPWTAVARDDDRNWVALVSGDPPVIERREVRLGAGLSHGVEVVDGLEAGDRIMRFEPRSQPEGRRVAAHGEAR
ncbi:MAG: efflux RND transporter periplasmic adaptor subunit [Puniceicoccaceae bacterium]|nr:MAG: efflux RND transporter periplasmic adaptor subunit [Puniceicoccaceae bacterium]